MLGISLPSLEGELVMGSLPLECISQPPLYLIKDSQAKLMMQLAQVGVGGSPQDTRTGYRNKNVSVHQLGQELGQSSTTEFGPGLSYVRGCPHSSGTAVDRYSHAFLRTGLPSSPQKKNNGRNIPGWHQAKELWRMFRESVPVQ